MVKVNLLSANPVSREQQTPRINEAWLREGWHVVKANLLSANPVSIRTKTWNLRLGSGIPDYGPIPWRGTGRRQPA